ncbi:DNAJ heat shock N-terminal domain-containing protein [Tasmannia lanceolata]|uniref:DNAJ heat shock N-terminal domain-containing protein n=1 Tax=Tasmannia lanceolata TaxID=3420 RepID=UPI00406298F2
MSDNKRCLYEILDLNRDCSQEEIRSSYRKLALQLHPDKLIKTGISEEKATKSFQELVNAYEVLSDPRERAWYDSHRSQILFANPSNPNSSSGFSPNFVDAENLFSFFSNSAYSGFSDSGKGFYKVYADVFSRIYEQEVLFVKKLGLGLGLGLDAVRDAPLMGNLDSPYSQVSAFYGYWIGFCTVMDFSWADQYHAPAGPNRKSRRVMEEENKKARRKAKREYIDMVRGLAEFVKKRDKRVVEMQLKRNLEEERRRVEEKVRKREAVRAKLEKARLFEEPEWARVDEEELDDYGFDEFEDSKKKNDKELYCVVCSKKFKSEKQWENHEKSKKHREKVAELKDSIEAEEEDGEEEEILVDGVDEIETHVSFGHVKVGDNVDELCEEFRDDFSVEEEQGEVKPSSDDDEGIEFFDTKSENVSGDLLGTDDEMSTLEAMVSRRKSRKNKTKQQPEPSSSKTKGDDDSDGVSFVEYDARKPNRRRNRASKKEGSSKSNADAARADIDGPHEEKPSNFSGGEVQVDNDNAHAQESSSHSFDETDTKSTGNQLLEKNRKLTNQSVDKKGSSQREANVKLKNSSRGKQQQQKATSKAASKSKTSGLACETCGENFDSRNKLFMHLGDTGHSMLKSR